MGLSACEVAPGRMNFVPHFLRPFVAKKPAPQSSTTSKAEGIKAVEQEGERHDDGLVEQGALPNGPEHRQLPRGLKSNSLLRVDRQVVARMPAVSAMAVLLATATSSMSMAMSSRSAKNPWPWFKDGPFWESPFVQAALFGGLLPPPPAGAGVLAIHHRPGARGATDGRIALAVKRIGGDAVRIDVRVEVSVCPIQQRIVFQLARHGVPFQPREPSPVVALGTPRAVTHTSAPSSARCNGSILRMPQQSCAPRRT